MYFRCGNGINCYVQRTVYYIIPPLESERIETYNLIVLQKSMR